MACLNANAGLVTTAEALALLKERKDERAAIRKKGRRAGHDLDTFECDWIVDKVMEYGNETPAGHQTREQIEQYLACLDGAGFPLTPAEKLRLVNLCARSQIEVHLAVEDCADRLDDKAIEQICAFTNQCFPAQPDLPLTAGEEDNSTTAAAAATTSTTAAAGTGTGTAGAHDSDADADAGNLY